MRVLRHAEDRRSLAFVATYWSLVAMAWTLDASSPWLRYGLMLPIAIFSFFCAVITHNTVHAPVFRLRWLNSLFAVVLSLSYGHPVSSYVPGHNLSHHKWLQTPRDIMRTSKLRFSWNLLNQLFFLPMVGIAITRAEWSYTAWARTNRPRWYRQLILESVVFYAVYGLLLYWDWHRMVIYVWLPHLYAAWGIVGINYIQHDGCDPNHPVNHSRNFMGLINPLCFNVGYHTAHYHNPALHWSELLALHRVIASRIAPQLNEPSFLWYYLRVFVIGLCVQHYQTAPLQYDAIHLTAKSGSP